jgi:hypothetical protein
LATRHGNGPGWGGPASGIPARSSDPSDKRAAFSPGNKAQKRETDPIKVAKKRRFKKDKAERIKQLTDHLSHLALNAETETLQVHATIAALNRLDGMPVAMQHNLNVETTLSEMVIDAAKLRKIKTTV